MSKLNDFIEEKIAPQFEKGGKYEKFWSIYDSFHTFLFVPRHTAGKRGVQVHDSVDSKRVISMVIVALTLVISMTLPSASTTAGSCSSSTAW